MENKNIIDNDSIFFDEYLKNIPGPLSEETKQPEVPAVVIEQLRTPVVSSQAPRETQSQLPRNSVMYDQPLYAKTASLVATDFFPDIKLKTASFFSMSV